jgi:hypothetical protein
MIFNVYILTLLLRKFKYYKQQFKTILLIDIFIVLIFIFLT